jgi:hypothetical protein
MTHSVIFIIGVYRDRSTYTLFGFLTGQNYVTKTDRLIAVI